MKRESPLRQAFVDLADVQPGTSRADQAIARALQAAGIKNSAILQFSGPERSGLRRPSLTLAALCSLLLVIAWFIGLNSNENILLAEALHRAADSESVTYTELHWATNQEGYRGPKTETKVSILGKYSERREQRLIDGGEKLPAGQGWFKQPEHYISIFDAHTGRLVTLYPEQKTFQLVKTLLGITSDGQLEENDVKPLPKANFYERMRRVPVEDAERLPEKKLGDKIATGYRLVEKVIKENGTDTWTRTYWVDPNSMLPIRIEVTHTSTDPMIADSLWIQRDIKFNVPLDESLFSTELPENYADVTRQE